MTKTIFSKVVWLGRATTFMVGLAVILALTVGLATTALAGTGLGARFDLGQTNTVNAVTKLVGSVAGPSLLVDNDSTAAGATALDLQVEPGKAPLRVNQAAGKATDLDSDQLDGLGANELVRASHVSGGMIDGFSTCNFQPLLTEQVSVPRKGVLLVWGGLSADRDPDSPAGTNPSLRAELTVEGKPIPNAETETTLYNEVQTFDASQSPSGAVAVGPGTKTVTLSANQCEPGQAFIDHRTLTTLFVPFGNAGRAGEL
jgi:hypothetical protein